MSTLPNVSNHETVNHSVHFVDPITGVHTQNIESYWARCKKKIKEMKGVQEGHLPEYLDEFMWRERYGKTDEDAFENLTSDIASRYPPPP